MVEGARRAVGVARLVRGDLGDDLAGVAVDVALGELGGDDLVQARPEGLDVGLLERRPRDVDLLAGVLAAQPGLEHHHDLVERPGALVVRRDQEQHAAAAAGRASSRDTLEALAHAEHALRRPDRRRVLGEPGDLVGAHVGAGRDHELVVGDACAVVELRPRARPGRRR